MGPLLPPQWIRTPRMYLAKRQLLSALAASFVALLLTFTLLPGDASARNLQCGERVTADVRLDADLRGCPGVGLVIDADGVTVDLGGHTIDGTGRGTGIVNGYGGDGHRGVLVRNGTVTGFKVGVRGGGRGFELRRLTVTKNATGGVVMRGSQCAVLRSTIADNGYGHGISLVSANGCRIDANRVTRHLGAGIIASRSDGVTIEDNRVAGSRRAGIMLATTSQSTVEHNMSSDNEVGISLFDRSSTNVVRRNSVSTNVTGIALTFGGTGNRIEQNTVSASRGAAIRLAETGTANAVVRNLVTLSAEEGIRVMDSAALRVEANTVIRQPGRRDLRRRAGHRRHCHPRQHDQLQRRRRHRRRQRTVTMRTTSRSKLRPRHRGRARRHRRRRQRRVTNGNVSQCAGVECY